MSRLSIEQAMGLGMEHHRAGRVQQAEATYRQILTAQPDQPDALHLLGLILAGYGRFDEGIGLIQRAIAMHPDVPDYHYNLAQVLDGAGQVEQAVVSYRRVIALSPELFEAHHNLGAVLMKLRRWEESARAFRQAVGLRPGSAQSQSLLGMTLLELGQADDALAAAKRAAAIEPVSAEALNNVGMILAGLGRDAQAIDWYRRAIAIRSDHAPTRHNLAMSNLRLGRLEEGWNDFEYRWRVGDPLPAMPDFGLPLWDGSPLNGRRIYLWPEQGNGDMIQFVRYAPLVAARGGKVVIGAPVELAELMRSVEGVERVVTQRTPDPSIDLHAPIMSLPRIFRTSLASIPASIPYLRADPEKSGLWRERLSQAQATFKVGIAWAGRPTHRKDRERSISLTTLEPLADVPGVSFVSLQKGDAATEARSLSAGFPVVDFTAELHDFADTAALIGALDLVISVDTAVAHLAGAMGKPVWVLLPFAADWRWMLDRPDSPWYPTMRLFRQSRIGEWDSPIARAADALQKLIQG